MSIQTNESEDSFRGLVIFKNKATGRAALYFSFELQPNREYSVQITADGETYDEIQHRSMKGIDHEIYLSFNVIEPGPNSLWPRVIDLGPSPA